MGTLESVHCSLRIKQVSVRRGLTLLSEEADDDLSTNESLLEFLVLFEALVASRRFLVSIFYEAGLGCRFNFCFLFLIPVHNLSFSTSLNLKERSLASILPDYDHRRSGFQRDKRIGQLDRNSACQSFGLKY